MSVENEIIDFEESDVKPDLYLASSGTRFGNYILDRIGLRIFIFGFGFLSEAVFPNIEYTTFFNIVFAISFIFFYYIFFEYFLGKTPAKLITGTKVVTTDGRKPDLETIFIRTCSRFIPFEAFSFFGSEPIGWHDSISKTLVVEDGFSARDYN